jgi:hypothetical protein
MELFPNTVLDPTERLMAVIKYVRNLAGLLSFSSRETQAIFLSNWCTQLARSVDFPKPAGAEMRVSFLSCPVFNFSNNRGRGIRSCRGMGINNFVDKIDGSKNLPQ